MACGRALDQAVEHFSRIDPTTRTTWGAFLDETSLAAKQGQAHYTLALTGRDPRAAGRAVPLLRHAVDHYGPDYAHLRVLNTALEPLHTSPGVTDLRNRITATAA